MNTFSNDELVTALKVAGTAHHDYESNALNGERDDHWPGCYAAYVVGRLGDFTTPTNLAGWLAQAPTSDDWVRSTADYIAKRAAKSK
jgi:hypothetical protein